MNDILSILKEYFPQIMPLGLMAVFAGWYLKHLSEQVLSNFKSIITESRDNFSAIINEVKKSKEDIYKDLDYYKKQLEEYRVDNQNYQNKIKELEEKIDEINSTISNIQHLMENKISQLNIKVDTLELKNQTLFSDKANILEDLELVWKTILRHHALLEARRISSSPDILKFKNQIKKNTA